MINNGRRWGFLGDFSYPIRKQGGMRVGEKNPASILSPMNKFFQLGKDMKKRLVEPSIKITNNCFRILLLREL